MASTRRWWFCLAAATWFCRVGVLLPARLAAQIGPEPDASIEHCLRTARVREAGRVLEGVTLPRRLDIECGGERRVAVFKTYEMFRRGVTRFGDGSWELNFSDSFRYERAAYLLDRELGLNMVPVAVVRQIGLEHGALIDWVYGHHPGDPGLTLTSRLMAALAPQRACMHLFDALIFNVDRNPSNWLTDSEGRLYLIDHSRSFRTSTDLPEEFSTRRIWLSRDLYRRLRDLERDRLASLFADLLEPIQIDAILARRNRLVEAIESARRRLGDEVVFRD